MSAPVIRAAGPCEVALLAELYRRCFDPAGAEGFAGTPWSARSLAEVMALPGVFALMALAEAGPDPEPAGFVLVRMLPEEAELLTLGVLPARRRAGFGTALLTAARAEAAQRGARRMTLEVAAGNTGAQALYLAASFVEAGRRRNYYRDSDGQGLDALVLACDLDRSESA